MKVLETLDNQEMQELMWNHLQGVIHDVNQGTCRANDRLIRQNCLTNKFEENPTHFKK